MEVLEPNGLQNHLKLGRGGQAFVPLHQPGVGCSCPSEDTLGEAVLTNHSNSQIGSRLSVGCQHT